MVANVVTETTAKNIDKNFTAELTVAFKTEAEKGNYIDIQNLNQKKPGAITETHQIFLPWVQTQRKISYMAIAVTTHSPHNISIHIHQIQAASTT